MDQTDKEHILRTNQYYIAQVSSMEIKISELKAQLHAKDFEIDYLSSKLTPSKVSHSSKTENYDVELQLSVALQENQLLKKKISDSEEISVVKSQLEHALHMKDLFEQKYREINLQVLLNEKQKTFISEKDEVINRLQKESENYKKSFEETLEKNQQLHEENTHLKCENLEKTKLIQDLKKRVFQRDKEKNSNLAIPSPSLFFRPSSAANSRKNSPDLSTIKRSHLRKNMQYQSPKLNLTQEIPKAPKIVNISLESTLPRP